MISGSKVQKDLSDLKEITKKYSEEINEAASYWKGQSYNNLSSKSNEFIQEYSSTLEGEMSAFASACDLYENYKTAKSNLLAAKSNYNSAVSSNNTSQISFYSSEISKYTNECNNLKNQIETCLKTASSTSLTASGLNGNNTSTQTDNSTSQEIIKLTGTVPTNGNVIDTSSPFGVGTKYNLTKDELSYLAYVAKREQGSVDGSKLELSLMVNLYEKNKSKYKSVVDYVQRSGWFSTASTKNYKYPGDEYYEAAEEVIAEGNRYLPSNIVEHDYLGDISSISTGSVNNRKDYIPGKTIIHNVMGATYKFVGFAPNGGDPFGYLV